MRASALTSCLRLISRPKLSDGAALDILRDRKGTMYDPLVVHTFERVYRILEADAKEAVADKPGGLLQLSAVTQNSRAADESVDSSQLISSESITAICKHVQV